MGCDDQGGDMARSEANVALHLQDPAARHDADLGGTTTRSFPPLVTIVICTRNRAAQLEGALRALLAIRSRHGWDAIVVDNGSTDATATMFAATPDPDRRMTYMRVDRVGLGAARDAATRAARGTILSFTDDDCYLDPGFVDAVAEVFGEHPILGCLGGRVLPYDPNDARVAFDERMLAVETEPYSFAPAGSFSGANLSFRREALTAAGGFDPRLGAGTAYPCEDIAAVAAVLWSGRPARFDPRPIVFHHHRRTEKDCGALFAGYDRGRGAYYARYILLRPSRGTYLAAVIRNVRSTATPAGLRSLGREARAGLDFAMTDGHRLAAICAAPMLLVAFGLASLHTGARLMRRSARRFAGRLPVRARPRRSNHLR